MALDPRTPEPEAIAALRALRNINPTTEQIAEALADRISDSQPRRARVRAEYDGGPPPYSWTDFDYRDPFEAFRQTKSDFEARAQQRRRRKTAQEYAQEEEARIRKQQEAVMRAARMEGAMNTARYCLEQAAACFEASRRDLYRLAGLAVAKVLLDPENANMPGSQIYQFVEGEYLDRMKQAGDPRDPEVLRSEFSILHAMIMARPHGHYV